MLHILVCDPDKNFTKYLKSLLQIYFYKLDYDTDIKIFNNGESFLDFYFKNNQKIDLIISEVDISDFSIRKLISTVRISDENLPIILITNNYKEIYNLVEFKLTNYIIKDNFSSKKEKLLMQIEDILSEKISIKIKMGHNLSKYCISDIMYFQIENRKIYMYLFFERKIFVSYRSLKELKRYLDNSFFKFANEYSLVNENNIISIKNNIISMKNGDSITISRRNKAYFKDI
ncbi:MAG: LytTR family transcriptional regulator DNA-binding domain-containing protein [Andreesenia angusta]|nr:LytTR family transcriptional regulator DNA-binding domain-containing protein [Andreesenia angusta]